MEDDFLEFDEPEEQLPEMIPAMASPVDDIKDGDDIVSKYCADAINSSKNNMDSRLLGCPNIGRVTYSSYRSRRLLSRFL